VTPDDYMAAHLVAHWLLAGHFTTPCRNNFPGPHPRLIAAIGEVSERADPSFYPVESELRLCNGQRRSLDPRGVVARVL
jgi:hypothetical protein